MIINREIKNQVNLPLIISIYLECTWVVMDQGGRDGGERRRNAAE